jgi:hypothetical protein
LKLAQDGPEAWKGKVAAALAAEKSRCAQETGEPAAPGALVGYGKAFEGCMRTRGWQRASNPV